MSERKARAALVYNPVKIDRDAVDSVLTAIESEVGWEPTLWLETSVEDPGQGQARQAREAGVDVVIAAGGDGTVRAVAEALRGSGLPLALLPSGTGNLLARNLDLTLEDLEHSLRVALTGTDRPIDAAVMQVASPSPASFAASDPYVFIFVFVPAEQEAEMRRKVFFF